jgi:hypothetical protein
MKKVGEVLKSVWLEFLKNGTARRLLVWALGLAAVALSKKFGFDLTAEQQEKIVALVLGYVAFSNVKDGLKKPDLTLEAAKAILEKGPPA